jgi:hypothetical protein
MYSKIEDLAIELWLEIFSYLKLTHQFNAFSNLNKRINQILFSYRTHLSSKNNDEDSQYLFTYILPCLTHRENVTCLKLENTNKVTQLIDKTDLLDFPRLKTLTLHRLNITKNFLDIFQQNTTHLRYLNISSLVSGNKKYLHQLLEMIISLQNLQQCRLRLGISMSPCLLQITSKSPMKDLRLIAMNENCATNRLIILLQYLPCLQSLHIIANQLNLTPMTDSANVCIAPISSFTLNLHQWNVSLLELTRFILTLTPHVQELKIICRTPLENLTYLNPEEWILFVQSLPNLEKLTLGIDRRNDIDEQIWTKSCQKLTKLISRYHITFRIGK